MGRRFSRVGVLVVAVTAASLVAAGPAGAANRFAAVGGAGGEPCLETDPCSIEVAINAADGGNDDDVTLLGGVPPAAPYVTSTPLSIPIGVTVHGAAGARPVIETDAENAVGVELHAGSALRDVVVEYSGINNPAVRLTGGGMLERVTAHATSGSGSTSGGCGTLDGGAPVIRDSICWHDEPGGSNGGGVEARNGSADPQTLTLRNVTAVSSNARPGLFAVRSSGGALVVNATNVIAQSGTGSDVGQIAGLSADAVNLDHSNYNTEADTAGTITNPGSGTNQTLPPELVNAAGGDFRQLSTSTGTIDLGRSTGVVNGSSSARSTSRASRARAAPPPTSAPTSGSVQRPRRLPALPTR